MYPTLIRLGPVVISSFGMLAVLSFIFGAFWIWRNARDLGETDELIFDNIMLLTLFSIIGSRLVHVIFNWEVFSPNSLRVFLFWSFPGLSVWGSFFLPLIWFTIGPKKFKSRKPFIFDAFISALPLISLIMSSAIFLDGTVNGLETSWFTALPGPGVTGLRHPVGLYALVISFFGLVTVLLLKPKAKEKPGILSLAALLFFGLTQFTLAIFRNDPLYLNGISVYLILSAGISCISAIFLIKIINGHKYILNLLQIVKNKIVK